MRDLTKHKIFTFGKVNFAFINGKIFVKTFLNVLFIQRSNLKQITISPHISMKHY